jgi:hypothetical protein
LARRADSIFPLDGVHANAGRAAAAYAAAGAADRFEAAIFEGGHGLPDEIKARAYGFLDRWLS